MRSIILFNKIKWKKQKKSIEKPHEKTRKNLTKKLRKKRGKKLEIKSGKNSMILKFKMNQIFKKIPGFVTLIRSFPRPFQTINAYLPKFPLEPDFQLIEFSKSESGSFVEKKMLVKDIKTDLIPLHFVKGIFSYFKFQLQ